MSSVARHGIRLGTVLLLTALAVTLTASAAGHGRALAAPAGPLAPAISGSTPWAILLCKPSDNPAEPQPRQYFVNFFSPTNAGSGNMADYWSQVSYGAINLNGTAVTSHWYTTAKTQAATQAEARQTKLQDCVSAVGSDIDLTPFYGIIAVYNYATSSGDSGAAAEGQADLGVSGISGSYAQVVAEPWSWTVTFLGHEMGHGYGLQHSWSNALRECSVGLGPTGEYCDPWDIMSAFNVRTFEGPWKATGIGDRGEPVVSGLAGPGLNAVNLDTMGWMPDQRRYVHPGSTATVRLAALSNSNDPGYLEARVPLDAAPGLAYLIEYRHASGWDRGIGPDTVLIHIVSPGPGYPSYIIEHNGDGSWLPGQTFTDPQAAINITVNAIGQLDGVHWAADVTIVDTGVTSTPQLYVPPTLSASPSQVRAGGSIQVTGQNFTQATNSVGNQASVYLDVAGAAAGAAVVNANSPCFGIPGCSQAAPNLLTRATLDQTGSFTASVNLPANVSAGQHTLIAVFEGQSAQVGIQVVAPAQALQPRLSIVGNRATVASVEGTMSYQVHGEGFASGAVRLYIDGPSGTALGTATAGSDGTFQVSVKIPDTFGPHQIVGVETVNGQTIQASIAVFVQPLPR